LAEAQLDECRHDRYGRVGTEPLVVAGVKTAQLEAGELCQLGEGDADEVVF
jgi:hypothetical protein